VGGAAGNAVGAVGGAARGTVGAVGGAARGAVGTVGGAARGAIGTVGGIAGGAASAVGGAASAAGSAVGGTTGTVGRSVGTVGATVGSTTASTGSFGAATASRSLASPSEGPGFAQPSASQQRWSLVPTRRFNTLVYFPIEKLYRRKPRQIRELLVRLDPETLRSVRTSCRHVLAAPRGFTREHVQVCRIALLRQ